MVIHYLVFLSILATLEHVCGGSVQYETINTQNGQVKGRYIQGRDGQILRMFLGIPYAEPPVGQLRFTRPQPKRPWSPEVLDATVIPPSCPQVTGHVYSTNFPTDEDCLYLNVYAPKLNQSSVLLPVMVWIHGGAYRFSSGSDFEGRYLAEKNVVVVTVNYRLGVLGFLATDDDVAPGNYALLDQIEALIWVKANIAKFGGDPNKVTIFGQSAGGGSVSLQLFSPLARGLFQAVIPQSGIALAPWAIYRPPYKVRDYTLVLARKLNCPTTSSKDIITCLRQKAVRDLVYTSVGGPPMIAVWAPRVDGYFIHDLPENLLSKGQYIRVPMMTGTVPKEGADVIEIDYIQGVERGFNATFTRGLIADFSKHFGVKANEVSLALQCQYRLGNDPIKNRDQFIQLRTDYGYLAPHTEMVLRYSRSGASVWMYNFEFLTSPNKQPSWMGVYHGTELYYLFGVPVWNLTNCPEGCPVSRTHYQNWTPLDSRISEEVMTIWTNFAKNFDPNPVPGLPQTWPKHSNHDHHHAHSANVDITYLKIDQPMSLNRYHNPRGHHFWYTDLPEILAGKAVHTCGHQTIVG